MTVVTHRRPDTAELRSAVLTGVVAVAPVTALTAAAAVTATEAAVAAVACGCSQASVLRRDADVLPVSPRPRYRLYRTDPRRASPDT